jgi:hypothetical protein
VACACLGWQLLPLRLFSFTESLLAIINNNKWEFVQRGTSAVIAGYCIVSQTWGCECNIGYYIFVLFVYYYVFILSSLATH